MDFKSIVGQKEIIASLENSIKHDKVGHAYVFSGPRGVGKKTIARIFSSLLLCTGGDALKSCGSCLPCQLFGNNSNPDFHVIEAVGSSVGVDDIRKLQSDIIIKPLYSGKKVYIIIDAEKMTVQAQNCLLKTLEEPPGFAVIILTTPNYGALLETIRSRAIRYNFRKNTPAEVRAALENGFGRELRDIDFIVAYADGNIGAALELAGSKEFMDLRNETLKIVMKISGNKLQDVFEVYSFFEDNRENIDIVLDLMLLFYRDLLVSKKARKENILINSDKRDIILSNVSGFSSGKILKNIQEIELARRNIKHNANFQLAVEVMLMKLQEAVD